MTQSAQQQQQQLGPEQRLARADTAIREVQNWMESTTCSVAGRYKCCAKPGTW